MCNELLRLVKLPSGRTVRTCLRCAWRDAGLCYQCGKPRTNDPQRGVMCEACRVASLTAANKRAREKPPAVEQRRAYDAVRYAARRAARRNDD
jgi:predicted amidophosphoribosyltransferase